MSMWAFGEHGENDVPILSFPPDFPSGNQTLGLASYSFLL
jgi:hypothetical protein